MRSTVITDILDFWNDYRDELNIIDPLDERDLVKLVRLIPSDDHYPFFCVHFDEGHRRLLDKETLQEFNDICIDKMVEMYNADENSYEKVRNMSKCNVVGGEANFGQDVPVVTHKSGLNDEDVLSVIEYTNWVITTDDNDDQVAKGCEAFTLMKEFSQQTDVFVIANSKDDCWLVNGDTGEKVRITHKDAIFAVIICESDEISFAVALRNLERYDTITFI